MGSCSNSFARLLGELQYITNAIWPDITYAVNRLASYTANPSLQHWTAIKRVLRYLSGIRDLGIVYRSNTDKEDFFSHTDAAYRNMDEFKSTMGYMFIASSGVITWSSKKQITQVQSSTEAEYIAMSKAA